MATDGRFDTAIARIDDANANDPHTVVVRGVSQPKELAHSRLVTEWVRELDPDASEALLLAARAHHLRRWEIPRASYPSGRSGYLRWRRELHGLHAREVGEILRSVGYPDATVQRVEAIVAKRDLGRDPEVQTFEDALCLAFVETQFHELAARIDRDRMVAIVRRTLAKMSAEARVLATGLDLDPADRAVIAAALATDDGSS